MAVFGLIGHKLGHSWSVPIHKALGRDDYTLIELEPNEVGDFFARTDICGLNVTIPYKRDVMAFCASLAESARLVGSVNTIVKTTRGLVGHNTDVAGLLYAAKQAGIEMTNRKVLIFGSGGASLAAVAAAKMQNAREIVVISRSGADGRNYESLARHAHDDAEIVINATPVGMYPNNGIAPADIALFPNLRGAIDLIYNPLRTAFLMRAKELGIPCTGGLAMLVAQAAAAEELFTAEDIGKIQAADVNGKPKQTHDAISTITRKLRCDMMNIVLIGMPGSGKSTVGQALAKLTGRKIIDIDTEIVKQSGRSISDIFAQDGEAAFRKLEREATSAAGKENGKIIVTGGGVVKDFANNYAPLHQNGYICHIERDTTLLAREGRPLSLEANLRAMYTERLPMYVRFRDAVVANDAAPRKTAAAIWRNFCEFCEHTDY